MQKLNFENKYDILIGDNIINHINEYIDEDTNILIISDDNVSKYHLENFKKVLNNKNIYTYVINNGEENKSIINYQNITKYLLDNNFTRNDYIINLGGGVVSDLGGFVASTFKRGIRYINIPTTTLAMIDSSIGGKVAINFDGYKNEVGSFYNPTLVFIDLMYLKTLDKRNYYNGLVEGLKMSLLDSKEFLDLFNDINNNLEKIILKSLEYKIKIVTIDPFDKGIRKVLNFGHTIAHAIEAKYMGQIYHGEAVAYGMIPFIESNELKEKVLKILNNMNIIIDDTKYQDLKTYIRCDKKCKLINNKLFVNVIKLKDINNYYFEDLDIEKFN